MRTPEQKLQFIKDFLAAASKKSEEFVSFEDGIAFLDVLEKNKGGFVMQVEGSEESYHERLTLNVLERLQKLSTTSVQYDALSTVTTQRIQSNLESEGNFLPTLQSIKFLAALMANYTRFYEVEEDLSKAKTSLIKLTEMMNDAEFAAYVNHDASGSLIFLNAYLAGTTIVEDFKDVIVKNFDPEFQKIALEFLSGADVFFNKNSITKNIQETSGPLESLARDASSAQHLELIKAGNKGDPLWFYSALLRDTYFSGNEVDNVKFHIAHALKRIQEVGTEKYSEGNLYQALRDMSFKEELKEVIAQFGPSTDLSLFLRTPLEKYFAGSKINMDNLPIYLMGYRILGNEGLVQNIVTKISKIENKGIKEVSLLLLSDALLKKEEHKKLIALSEQPIFQDFAKDHPEAMLMIYWARMQIGKDISQYTKEISEIEPKTIEQFANQLSLLNSVGDKQSAMQKVAHFIERTPHQSCAFFILNHFRDHFIYNRTADIQSLEAINPTMVHMAIESYKKLSLKCEPKDQTDIFYLTANKSLLKLCHTFNRQAEMKECLSELATVDARVKAYQDSLAENPLSDEEREAKMISDLNHIFHESEKPFAEQISNYWIGINITQQLVLISNQKISASSLYQDEDVKESSRNVKIRDLTIDLLKCQEFSDENATYFIYKEPKMWSKISEDFEEALSAVFVKATGHNGIKYINQNAFEIKVDGVERVLGSLHKVKDEHGKEVNIINFSYFCKNSKGANERSSNEYNAILDQINKAFNADKEAEAKAKKAQKKLGLSKPSVERLDGKPLYNAASAAHS